MQIKDLIDVLLEEIGRTKLKEVEISNGGQQRSKTKKKQLFTAYLHEILEP